MPRLMLSDELWSKLRKIMCENGVYDKPCLRLSVEGILYRMRVGCTWRDLPRRFGKWNSVYKKFNYWSRHHKIVDIFRQLVCNPELSMKFTDGSFIRAHQHSTGDAGPENQDIGKSKGGNTTKIHMAVDANGKPIEFYLSPGNVNDSTMATKTIVDFGTTEFVVADKGYDSNQLRDFITQHDATPVIPRKINSKIGNNDMNWAVYKLRHLVENIFHDLRILGLLLHDMINYHETMNLW